MEKADERTQTFAQRRRHGLQSAIRRKVSRLHARTHCETNGDDAIANRVVGYGFVGRALDRFLTKSHEVFIYDKFLAGCNKGVDKSTVQCCDLVFIAVPTPATASGSSDISAVEEVVDWVDAPMCVKSNDNTWNCGAASRSLSAVVSRVFRTFDLGWSF
jgi:predicted dinucleotide-binding enzyme